MQRGQCRQSVVDPPAFTRIALLLPARGSVLRRCRVFRQRANCGQPCSGVPDLLDPFGKVVDRPARRPDSIRICFESPSVLAESKMNGGELFPSEIIEKRAAPFT